MAERSIAFGLFAKDHASVVFKKVSDAAEKSAQTIDKANAHVTKSTLAQADAAGKVRVAELKLKELRESGKATASQLGKAEEALASAQRKQKQSAIEVERATKDLETAQAHAATKSGSLRAALEALRHEGKKTDGVFHKISTTAAGVFAGLSVSALAGRAVDFMKQSVHAAIADENAQIKLQQAIKNSGRAYADLAPQIEHAQKSMLRFGFTDDETTNALAVMTTSLKDPAKALSLLGTAADLAKFKNISLSDAALITAKAVEGQLRPLRALGIDAGVAATSIVKQAAAQKKAKAAHEEYLAVLAKSHQVTTKSKGSSDSLAAAESAHALALQRFNMATAKTPALQEAVARTTARLEREQAKSRQTHVKYGASTEQVTKAYKKWQDAQGAANASAKAGTDILKALSDAVHGQAAAAADTYAGKMAYLSASVDYLKMNIGMALMPKLVKLADWFTGDGMKAIMAFIGGFTGKKGVDGVLTDAETTAYNFGQSVKGAMETAGSAIGAVVSYISDHQAGIAEFAKIAASIWTAFKVFTSVQAVVSGIMSVATALGVLSVAEGAASASTAVPAILGGAAMVASGLAMYGFLNNFGKSLDTKTPTKIADAFGGGNYLPGLLPVISTQVKPRAAGGPVASGSPYLVGEQGPELFVPQASGTIIPNGRGITENHLHVTIQGNVMTEDQTLRWLRDGLAQMNRRNGAGTAVYGV